MDAKLFVLNKDFESIAKITDYISLMWIDRYNEPGEFEIYLPINKRSFEYFKGDNYFYYGGSDHLMIIEDLEVNTERENVPILIARGRSLESIIDRRILLYDTVFNENLEDAIRQILDVSLMQNAGNNRKIDNFIFEYSYDSRINSLTCNYEFNKGDNLRDVIEKIIKGAKLGYKVILNDDDQFVFKCFIGDDRSYDQEANPYVIFSPRFNNLSTSKFVNDGGENFRNVIYTYGEEYNDQEPQELIVGTTTGLLRREMYNDASSISHEVTEGETTKTLTPEEYTAQLKQSADDLQLDHIIKQTAECQIDYKVNFEYGKDYFVGDIVQVENEFGQEIKMRVTEFITSISNSGVELYPTLKNITEEDEEN